MTFENEYMLFGNVKSWKSLKNTITLLSLVDFSSWPQISLFLYRSLFSLNAICSWNVNLGKAIVVFWVRIVRHAAYRGTNLCDDGIFRSALYLGKTALSRLTGWTTEPGRKISSEQLACCGRGTCHGFQSTVGSATTEIRTLRELGLQTFIQVFVTSLIASDVHFWCKTLGRWIP